MSFFAGSRTETELRTPLTLVAIPTEPNGGNHTAAFTSAAATPEAHQACLEVCKALALTGLRVIQDDRFYSEVRNTVANSSLEDQLSIPQVRTAFEKDVAISQVA